MSLSEWDTFVETNIDKDPTYFCKMNIFVSPIAGRTIDLAADYWEAAQLEAANWMALVDSPQLSYMTWGVWANTGMDESFLCEFSILRYIIIF